MNEIPAKGFSYLVTPSELSQKEVLVYFRMEYPAIGWHRFGYLPDCSSYLPALNEWRVSPRRATPIWQWAEIFGIFEKKKKNLSMEISELFTALTPEFKKESNSNSIITVFLADYIHQFWKRPRGIQASNYYFFFGGGGGTLKKKFMIVWAGF